MDFNSLILVVLSNKKIESKYLKLKLYKYFFFEIISAQISLANLLKRKRADHHDERNDYRIDVEFNNNPQQSISLSHFIILSNLLIHIHLYCTFSILLAINNATSEIWLFYPVLPHTHRRARALHAMFIKLNCFRLILIQSI